MRQEAGENRSFHLISFVHNTIYSALKNSPTNTSIIDLCLSANSIVRKRFDRSLMPDRRH